MATAAPPIGKEKAARIANEAAASGRSTVARSGGRSEPYEVSAG